MKAVKCSHTGCNEIIVIPEKIPPTMIDKAGTSGTSISHEPKNMSIEDFDFKALREKLTEPEIKQIEEFLKSQNNDQSKKGNGSKIYYCKNAHPNIIST